MATTEASILIRTKSAEGDVTIHYPITLGGNIVVSDETQETLGVTTTEGTLEEVLIQLVNTLKASVPSGVLLTHDTTGETYRLGLDDSGLYTVKQE